MTWASIIANGGKPNLRLSIEGFPDEWVTHSDIAGTATDGRERREGLSYDGLVLEEQADLRTGMTKASSMTVTIRSPHALAAFSTRSKLVTSLRQNATDSDTTLAVKGHSAITANDYVHLNTEAVKVTAKGGTSPNFTLTVTRQQWGTKAQKHFQDPDGLEMTLAPVYDRPRSMNGRRALLYAYDEDELGPSSAGTQIWMGIVDGGPELAPEDNLTWTIAIRPITDLLDGDVTQLTHRSVPVRGIYYSAMSPLVIYMEELHATTFAVINSGILKFTGHYENKEAMVSALNTELSTMTSGWTIDEVVAIVSPGGQLAIEILQDATTARIPVLLGYSPHDGALLANGPDGTWRNVSNATVQTHAGFTTGDYFHAYFPGMSPGPFGYLGTADRPINPHGFLQGIPTSWHRKVIDDMLADQSAAATAPANRVYVGSITAASIAVGDSVNFENVAVGSPPNYTRTIFIQGASVRARVAVIDTTDGYVELEDALHIDPPDPESANFHLSLLGPDTVVRTGKEYTGNVHDFLDGLVAESVNVNLGFTPSLTTDDIDVGSSSEWEDTVDAQSPGEPFFHRRAWAFDKGIALNKVIEHELKLLGLIMRLQSDGKIGVVKRQHALKADTGKITIDGDVIVTPPMGGWPRWRLNRDGLVNVIEFYRGTDIDAQEQSKIPDFVATDKFSVAEHRNRGAALEKIQPVSYTQDEITQSRRDSLLSAIAMDMFGFFAADYHAIEIDVLPSVFTTALVGATVLLTSNHVPAGDGTMGVTAIPAMVVGRRWSLDPAINEPMGKLTLVTQQDQGGYAPSARISSATDNGSDDWTCTVEANKYSPAGEVDASYFEALYEVNVIQHDVRPVNEQTGHVISVSGNDIRIQFDGAAPWGVSHAGVYDIRFVQATSTALVVGNQSNYVYNADVDEEAYNASGSDPGDVRTIQ